MKQLRKIGELIIIWMISLLFFTLFFSIYGTSMLMNKPQFNPIEILIIFLLIFVFTFIFSCICSLPAFVIFATSGFAILQIPMHTALQRVLLLLVNYAGIFFTCLVAFVCIATASRFEESALYPLYKYVLWYPNWALVISSTAGIILMPLGTKSPLTQIIQK